MLWWLTAVNPLYLLEILLEEAEEPLLETLGFYRTSSSEESGHVNGHT